jgi:hypothetical protein
MKNWIVIILVLFMIDALGQTQAQVSKNENPKEVKKEVRAERKALKKLKGPNINPASKASFAKEFGTQAKNVAWKLTDYYDEATFEKGGKWMTAYYDEDGSLVGTTNHASVKDIPVVAQNYIQKHYMKAVVKDVIFFDDNEYNETDMFLYGLQFDDADNYFVELTQGKKQFVVVSDPKGKVTFFKQL